MTVPKIVYLIFRPFKINKGITQDSCMSPTPFKFYIQSATQTLANKFSGKGYRSRTLFNIHFQVSKKSWPMVKTFRTW